MQSATRLTANPSPTPTRLPSSALLDFKKQRWSGALAHSKAAAYHTWMHHFHGGAEEDLVAPPTSSGISRGEPEAQEKLQSLRWRTVDKSELGEPVTAAARSIPPHRTPLHRSQPHHTNYPRLCSLRFPNNLNLALNLSPFLSAVTTSKLSRHHHLKTVTPSSSL